jgi:hypothetical protein
MITRIILYTLIFFLIAVLSLAANDFGPNRMQILEQFEPVSFNSNQVEAMPHRLPKKNAVVSEKRHLVTSYIAYDLWNRHTKHTLTYTDNDQIATHTLIYWKDDKWLNIKKTNFSYDTNGNKITELVEKWIDNEWENYNRELYTYDNYGNLLLCTRGFWEDSKWNMTGRDTFAYDNYGNLTSLLHESFSNNQWKNSKIYTYTYDSYGNQLTEFERHWSGSVWDNNQRFTYTYDTNGNQLSSIWEQWRYGVWEKSWRKTYTYDSDMNQTMFLLEGWSEDYSCWVNVSRYTNKYNSNGRKTKDIREIWYELNWRLAWEMTYLYDSFGNQITRNYRLWELDELVQIQRYNCSYDGYGNLQTMLNERLRTDNWEEYDTYFYFETSYGLSVGSTRTHKIEVTWEEVTSVDDWTGENFKIKFSPNPFTESTKIEYTINDPALVNIYIFDNLGNRITSAELGLQSTGQHSYEFLAKDLSQGIYYYTIQIGKQSQSGKLLLVK